MKKLICFFIVLLLAVGLGVLMHNHPAYVLISIGHTHIQLTLWLVIITLIIVGFIVYQLLHFLRGIYRLPSRIRHFTEERRQRKLQMLTSKALRALLENRWQECENYFRKSAKKDHYPFFHYMAAAQAAFEQKKPQDADRYLNKAQLVAKSADTLALEMVRTRWQLLSGEYPQALVNLQLLQKVSPTHAFVLNGLKEVYLAAKNWQNLYELLPQLQKYAGLDESSYDALERQVLIALLDQAGQLKSLLVLEKKWETIPKKWRKEAAFIAIYAKHLIELNRHDRAEQVLKRALKNQQDAALLQQYARVNSQDPVKQLARAESWLKQEDKNPDLLWCLGSLCARHRLWGKAKTYLELSLKYKTRSKIYPVLGEVLEQLDEKHAALACYKRGLSFLIEHFEPG